MITTRIRSFLVLVLCAVFLAACGGGGGSSGDDGGNPPGTGGNSGDDTGGGGNGDDIEEPASTPADIYRFAIDGAHGFFIGVPAESSAVAAARESYRLKQKTAG